MRQIGDASTSVDTSPQLAPPRFGFCAFVYRFLFWQERDLEGYLVLQEYTSEGDLRDVLNIVDWEASQVPIKARLLESAISAFGSAVPVVIWSATLHRQEIEILHENRFRPFKVPDDPLRAPPAILVRPIKNSPSEDQWKLDDKPLLHRWRAERRSLPKALTR